MTQLLLLVALSFGANAELDTHCKKMWRPVPWEYCIYKTVGSANTDVVYHLHGAGENVHAYVEKPEGEKIRQAWVAVGKPAPIVVSISFGPIWLLASKNSSRVSGLYDVFLNRVMPYIETRALKIPPTSRYLFGYSMGGYNGSQLFLKNPELFRKVVLGCPAVVSVSPYAPQAQIDAYIARTHADPTLVDWMLKISRAFYPDDAAYQKDAPLATTGDKLAGSTTPLHLSCGDKDEFGFLEGALRFRDITLARGVNVTWEQLEGGHCVLDPQAIADFLR